MCQLPSLSEDSRLTFCVVEVVTTSLPSGLMENSGADKNGLHQQRKKQSIENNFQTIGEQFSNTAVIVKQELKSSTGVINISIARLASIGCRCTNSVSVAAVILSADTVSTQRY